MYNKDKPSLNELIHFGTLGMHWGRHKAKQAAKKLQKADAKWEKAAKSMDTMIAINNRSADRINTQLEGFNKKWGKVNFNDPKLAAYNARYEKAYGKLWDKNLNQSVSELLKANPSGTKQIKAVTSQPGALPTFVIVDKE